MIVYIDLVVVINLIFDFCLLLSVDLLLKRNAKFIRVFLGSLVGELSILTLFINFNTFTMFTFKVILSVVMSLVAFGKRDVRYTFYNTIYLYLAGIILGGFVTYLFNEFEINREYSLKYLFVIVLSPVCLLVYYQLMRVFKMNYNNQYKVIIEYEGKTFEGVGFLDSGNKLMCPISGKPIILIEKEYITLHKLKLLPVPYNALNYHGIIYTFKPDSVTVNDHIYKDIRVGLSDVKFNIDGVSILLNARMENI